MRLMPRMTGEDILVIRGLFMRKNLSLCEQKADLH